MGFWLALQPVGVHVFALERTSSGHTGSGRPLTCAVRGACHRCGVCLCLLPAPSRCHPQLQHSDRVVPPTPCSSKSTQDPG